MGDWVWPFNLLVFASIAANETDGLVSWMAIVAVVLSLLRLAVDSIDTMLGARRTRRRYKGEWR